MIAFLVLFALLKGSDIKRLYESSANALFERHGASILKDYAYRYDSDTITLNHNSSSKDYVKAIIYSMIAVENDLRTHHLSIPGILPRYFKKFPLEMQPYGGLKIKMFIGNKNGKDVYEERKNESFAETVRKLKHKYKDLSYQIKDVLTKKTGVRFKNNYQYKGTSLLEE